MSKPTVSLRKHDAIVSFMFRVTVIIVVNIILIATAGAYDHKYALGVRGGVATLSGGDPDSAKFTFEAIYGVAFSYHFAQHWLLDFDLSILKLYNNPSAKSSFSFSGDKSDATQTWKATRLGILARRFIFSPDNMLNVTLGLGGGLLIWKYVDPDQDTTLKVRGPYNGTVDYSASEIFVTGAAGIEALLSRRLSLKWNLCADHLTTAGTEFGAGVNSARPRWLVGSSLTLSFAFGQVNSRRRWKSEQSWASTVTPGGRPATNDRDNKSIPRNDEDDFKISRIAGINSSDTEIDSDHDGVNDWHDDCPNTDRRARGKVDIFGCPVDSDFDGIHDYLDDCPFGPIGARIDAHGCPLDSDADGVPDGLDDCPNTLYGVEVDGHGCIDLSILSKPLVLNIDYAPGSFEVDPSNREKIKQLARILNFVPTIKLEINGYTDNIGRPRANKLLSEKRARRVRDYLVAYDVSEDRIKVFGKGESNFVASNQTAEGRAKNRRIEIIFYR